MKFTSFCLYALRALLHLARHEGTGFASAKAIAEAEGLSDPYLAKALKALTSAGVLHSLKGPHGGYRLARPARSITLLEVMEAVDGPLRGEAPRLGGKMSARLRGVCDGVAESVRHRLRKVSLADLAGEGE
jgi:Rrf2 family protein